MTDTGDHETHLFSEDKIVFWECPSCNTTNATVIGEKAYCVQCKSMPMKPKAVTKPVL